MDCEGRSCNAIEIVPEAPVPVYNEPLSSPSNDQSIWATEDDYRAWNDAPFFQTTLHPSHDSMQHTPHPQLRAGSQHSPSKMPSGSSQRDSAPSSSKLMNIGKTLFKTKLCCKFRSGTCAYITNCNFAHSMEELRKPPPNWQETVVAHDGASVLKLREERQIPILTSSAVVGDGQRSYKGRHCKKFYNDEGCPYGDSCSFLHDEQSRARESVAISLSPTIGGDGCGIGGSGSFQKPSNWKTRICNKWEMTGHCLFGSKCHFAHGAAELHGYCGGLAEFGANEASCAVADPKKVVTNTTAAIDAAVSYTSLPCADTHPTAAPLQWPTVINPRMIQRPIQKWKGPDKISRIYGDWINDID